MPGINFTAIAKQASSALKLIGKKGQFVLRRYEKGITSASGTSGNRPRREIGPPLTALGYVGKTKVFVISSSIGTAASQLSDQTVFWTVKKYDHHREQNVDGAFMRFAPGDDTLWVAYLEEDFRPNPGGP